jgi:hypothetical protein
VGARPGPACTCRRLLCGGALWGARAKHASRHGRGLAFGLYLNRDAGILSECVGARPVPASFTRRCEVTRAHARQHNVTHERVQAHHAQCLLCVRVGRGCGRRHDAAAQLSLHLMQLQASMPQPALPPTRYAASRAAGGGDQRTPQRDVCTGTRVCV